MSDSQSVAGPGGNKREPLEHRDAIERIAEGDDPAVNETAQRVAEIVLAVREEQANG